MHNRNKTYVLEKTINWLYRRPIEVRVKPRPNDSILSLDFLLKEIEWKIESFGQLVEQWRRMMSSEV